MAIPSDPPDPKFAWPRSWWTWLMDFCLWCKSKQPIPSKNDFSVDEGPEGVRFRLNKVALQAIIADTAHRLQLIDASESGVPKVRVRLGKFNDLKADAGMADPSDDPVFTLTLPSSAATRYILGKITVSYDVATSIWTVDDSEVIYASSVTAPTATLLYIEIGSVEVVSNGAGGYALDVNTPQPVSGDQNVTRTGNATSYVDNHALQ